MKKPLTRKEVRDLETLPIIIPNYLKDSSPFSSGQKIEKYKEDDLKKIPSSEKTDRTDWFEKRLLGIWLKIGRPVPYAFRANDGEAHSLDAGSLAYLMKRSPPDLEATLDDEGYIISVEPTDPLRKRYAGMERRLIEDIQPAADRILTSADANSGTEELPPATEPVEAIGSGLASSLLDSEFDIDAPVDERRKTESLRVIRDGAKQFREVLLRVWGSKCAITETRVADALDGAHIYPYLGKKTNLAVNGVLLRADLHRLFDRYLVTFRYDEGNLVIAVSKKLAETEYAIYSGQHIKFPAAKRHQPDGRVVGWHYRKFQNKEKIRNLHIEP